MRVSWTLVMLILLAPAAALACPVCGTGPERSREAYVSMTMVLSLLPLAMVGGLIFVFVRRARQKATPEDMPEPSIPASEAART